VALLILTDRLVLPIGFKAVIYAKELKINSCWGYCETNTNLPWDYNLKHQVRLCYFPQSVKIWIMHYC